MEPYDDVMLAAVLDVTARGIPAVTLASWTLASGNPKLVPPQSVLRHRPLPMKTKWMSEYSIHFKARSQSVICALHEFVKLAGSTWHMRQRADQPSARPKGVASVSFHGTDDVRVCMEEHRRILNLIGARVAQ